MDTDKRIAELEKELKSLRSFADEARGSLEKMASQAKERMEDEYDDLKDDAENLWETAQEKGQKLIRKTRRGAKRAYYNTVDYTQEHPWRVTSSVLALIAIVGAIGYVASERSNNQLDMLKRRYRDLF